MRALILWSGRWNSVIRNGLLDMPAEGWDLIRRNDDPFKAALDHTKYTTRYPDLDPAAEREKAAAVLLDLNSRLTAKSVAVRGRSASCGFCHSAVCAPVRLY